VVGWWNLPALRKRPEDKHPVRTQQQPSVRWFLSLICLLIAIAIFLFNLWNIRLLPSLSTDGLIYHLTIPAFWIHEGFLRTIDLPFHDGAAEHSPLITESLIYLLMRITGDDSLAWLIQPVFFLLIAWAYYRSLRLLELDADTARFLTALLLLFPPFFRSAQIVNNEMVLTSGTALFCFGMLLTRTHQHRGCWFASAGVALMLAAKTIGVIYGSLALLILAAWIGWAARRQARHCARDSQTTPPAGDVNAEAQETARGRCRGLLTPPAVTGNGEADSKPPFYWRTTALVCAVTILAGSAFQLRNLWEFGNPLYPARLSLAGLSILPGRYDPSVFVTHGWSPDALYMMLFNDLETFSMRSQYGGLLWLALLVTVVHLARRRLRSGDAVPTILFVCYPLAAVIMYFAVTPFWREHRLLFPVYYLLWGGLAWSLCLSARGLDGRWANRLSATVAAVTVFHTLAFVFFDEVPLWLAGGVAALGVVLGNYPQLWAHRGRMRLAGVVLFGLAAVRAFWCHADYVKQREAVRAEFYSHAYAVQGDAWNRIAEETANRPATIAYSGSAVVFPLFGAKLQNRLVYLRLDPDDQPQPIELTGSASIYLQLARQRRSKVDEAYWLNQLRENRVDWLYLVDDPALGGVQAELSLAAAHPRMLQPIFQEGNLFLYRVHRADIAGPSTRSSVD
jgi:hypothetical protein